MRCPSPSLQYSSKRLPRTLSDHFGRQPLSHWPYHPRPWFHLHMVQPAMHSSSQWWSVLHCVQQSQRLLHHPALQAATPSLHTSQWIHLLQPLLQHRDNIRQQQCNSSCHPQLLLRDYSAYPECPHHFPFPECAHPSTMCRQT